MTPHVMHWCRVCKEVSFQVVFFTVWGDFYRWCTDCSAESHVVEAKR